VAHILHGFFIVINKNRTERIRSGKMQRRVNQTFEKLRVKKSRGIQILLPFLLITLLSTSLYGQNVTKVIRVIDGDTLHLTNGEKVRLIGVDTPETRHPQKPVERFGKEAYLFTKRMVEGKEVRLEFDWQRRDKYGRLLAYVYLTDGAFLNAEIIKQGYGFAYKKYPFKYFDEFEKFEKEARENGRGLWKESER
jgi:endonuclease YncB( thermonuclease family)